MTITSTGLTRAAALALAGITGMPGYVQGLLDTATGNPTEQTSAR